MPGNRHSPRIDTMELKLHIQMKLGRQKSEQYFQLLGKYLSLKLSGKSKLDRLCIELLGRENISLHNGLIRSIITNACTAKIPPPKHGTPQTLVNALPQSPKKGRTRKFKDRKVPEPSVRILKVPENQTAIELISSTSVPPVEGKSGEESDEVEQDSSSTGNYKKAPVRPPYGVSFNTKGVKKVLVSPLSFDTCSTNGELPDTSTLRARLEHKLAAEGINVSTDCVSLLNNGLDSFIKRLIKPCIDIAKARARGANESFSASMTDFRAAMETNPTILGEDWPEKLERVMEG